MALQPVTIRLDSSEETPDETILFFNPYDTRSMWFAWLSLHQEGQDSNTSTDVTTIWTTGCNSWTGEDEQQWDVSTTMHGQIDQRISFNWFIRFRLGSFNEFFVVSGKQPASSLIRHRPWSSVGRRWSTAGMPSMGCGSSLWRRTWCFIPLHVWASRSSNQSLRHCLCDLCCLKREPWI